MPDRNKDFGDLIRTARQRKGYTQATFAQAFGASQQSVSRWETGDVPPLTTMASLSQALDIPLETLSAYQPTEVTLADRVRELENFRNVLDAELEAIKGQLTADGLWP